MNKQICLVCREKQKNKQNKFVRLFFGESTARQSDFGFIWPLKGDEFNGDALSNTVLVFFSLYNPNSNKNEKMQKKRIG